LKVSDVFRLGPFQVLAIPNVIELGYQILSPAAREIPGASRAAEGAAPGGDASVSVRASESGIQHYFEYFSPERFAHFIVPGMKSFIRPEKGTPNFRLNRFH
jgi:hypothetical protein